MLKFKASTFFSFSVRGGLLRRRRMHRVNKYTKLTSQNSTLNKNLRSLIVAEVPSQDLQGCLDLCRDNSGDCLFFTYYEEEELCRQFANCDGFSEGRCGDEEDGECFTGSADCEGDDAMAFEAKGYFANHFFLLTILAL